MVHCSWKQQDSFIAANAVCPVQSFIAFHLRQGVVDVIPHNTSCDLVCSV